MIIIIGLDQSKKWYVEPGDKFKLTIINNIIGIEAPVGEVVIEEVITKHMVIDFVASFRFALEDGTCDGNHLAGIFANSRELPKEIKAGVMIDDLTPEQFENFKKSVAIEI